MTVELEETMIPINDVTAKPIGMVKNCDHSASFGFLAKRVKSGSFTISVAKFEMLLMIPCTMAQPKAPPLFAAG